MIAAIISGENPKFYGFDVSNNNFKNMADMELENPHKISEIAKYLAVSQSQIKNWNPELKKHITPPPSKGKPYKFKLPSELLASFKSIKDKLTKLKIDDIHIHKIRTGESLYRIARKYGVPVKKIMNFNPKLSPRRIRPGTRIAVPIPSVTIDKG